MKTRIFTLFYSSTFDTVLNNIPVGWPSTIDSISHFDYSYAIVHPLQFVALVLEEQPMAIFRFSIFIHIQKKNARDTPCKTPLLCY